MKQNLFFITTTIIAMFSSTTFAQLDRTRKPDPQPTPKITLPAIQHAALANGLKIILVERHELPIVQMQLVFQTGAANDPAGKAGTANLTAQMVREGTGKR